MEPEKNSNAASKATTEISGRKVLFIDRDGTLIVEPVDTYQIDSLEKLEYLPGVFRNLYQVSRYMDYELVIVTNQDGLGRPGYAQEDFDRVQEKMLQAFENEGIHFKAIHVDDTLASEGSPNRKPATGMLQEYLEGDYDLAGSYVIGDRLTDVELAKNLGARGILLGMEANAEELAEMDAAAASETREAALEQAGLLEHCALVTPDWDTIYQFLRGEQRSAVIQRKTRETDVRITLSLDGTGNADISTGLGFFDHMLEQIAKHGGMDLEIKVKGDLYVDEHHTIEDTGLALGSALLEALGDKRGIKRYAFTLPMDDSLASVAIDLGGRPWLVWEADFKREMVGDMPTELFSHFFKSFSDNARCNLNIKVEGDNEHHKIEGIFKAFARALKGAVALDPGNDSLPSTKGML